jgi:hypothetical protein
MISEDPHLLALPCSSVVPNKNPRPSLRRPGINGKINPHRILTPKTVQGPSRQVFWLSLFFLPSHPEIGTVDAVWQKR